MPRFTQQNATNAFHVFLWSVGAAAATLGLALLAEVELPEQWLFIGPILNTVLYSLKEFFSRNGR